MPDETEQQDGDAALRDQLIAFIAKRDHVSLDRAKAIFATLSPADLIHLELQVRPSRPRFEADYDPYAR